MPYSNKIDIRFVTVKKEDLIKEQKKYGYASLSHYLRVIIDNRKLILEVLKDG